MRPGEALRDIMRYEDVYEEIVAGTAHRSLPAWASGVLYDIATGRRVVAAVRHPLGFLCLPLERRDPVGVCLHIWSPRLDRAHTTTSEVHCHSWDLCSYVLYGQVRNVPFRIAAGSAQRIFEVFSRGDEDEIRATPRTVRPVPEQPGVHRAGDAYALPAGVFHSTVIEEGHDAATIALGRTSPETADLSLGALATRTHRVRRQRCDGRETALAARATARRLAATYAASPRAGPGGRL
jgi:hypothetical protein